MEKEIKGYVFDIGNVLIKWNPSNITRKYADQKKFKFNEAVRITEEMNLRVDKGEGFNSVIEEYINNYPEFEELFRDWRDNWSRMFTPKINGTWNILNQLKEMGYKTYALSNFGRQTFEIACQAYPELKNFDRIFISSHLGIVKPDDRIYEIVERDTGLNPSELFFIDDRKINCVSAQSRGWTVHKFINAKKLSEHIFSIETRLKILN